MQPALGSILKKHRREEGAAAATPFRGPAADSRLGELFLDVIGLVTAMGFVADVSQCVYVCGVTFRRGAAAEQTDMLTQSLQLQCGARKARAAVREDFSHERLSYNPQQRTFAHCARSAALVLTAQQVARGGGCAQRDKGLKHQFYRQTR